MAPLLAGRWFEGFEFDATLDQIPCPVLLLYGEQQLGGMLPSEDAIRIANRLTDVVAVQVTGVGHLIHWQALAETVRHVVGFLETIK